MPRLLLLLSLVFLAAALLRAAGEEFVGPFPSWTDVKAGYGAVGDGMADDTDALQHALDALGKGGTVHVLFLPAGIYRITRGLTLTGKGSIIGQNPLMTIIKWDGGRDGVMLRCGQGPVSIKRLTWNGAGKPVTAVAHACDEHPAGAIGLAHSDEIFTDLAIGIRAELPATAAPKHEPEAQNSTTENPVLRCQFLRCREAGACAWAATPAEAGSSGTVSSSIARRESATIPAPGISRSIPASFAIPRQRIL